MTRSRASQQPPIAAIAKPSHGGLTFAVTWQGPRLVTLTSLKMNLFGFCLHVNLRRRVANALCDIYGFMPELHRYLMCEPEVAVADYWVSPYAIGWAPKPLQVLNQFNCASFLGKASTATRIHLFCCMPTAPDQSIRHHSLSLQWVSQGSFMFFPLLGPQHQKKREFA